MTHKVVLAPEAQADLVAIYDYIAKRGGPDRAFAYTKRVLAACRGLAAFPERGAPRDDVRPGLRILGFERRVTIVPYRQGNGRHR